MDKKYDFLVYIGRFQPFHNGHLAVIEDALTKADKVIVAIGSSHIARSVRNPFTAAERQMMIQGSLSPLDRERVKFAPVTDHPYNYDKWLAEVQGAVHTCMFDTWKPGSLKVGLIGYKKDHSSAYLDMFPQWGYVETDSYLGLNATEIREAFFLDKDMDDYWEILPKGTQHFLKNYSYPELRKEFQFIERYKKEWPDDSYNTADAVVIQSGHILMITRKNAPGKGLMALPGGFIGKQETIRESGLRELREETGLKVPQPVLEGSISAVKTFDDPFRSARGRIITTAYLFNLKDDKDLPHVKGGDDADKAFWVPLSSLKREELFEDHYDIIEYMVGI